MFTREGQVFTCSAASPAARSVSSASRCACCMACALCSSASALQVRDMARDYLRDTVRADPLGNPHGEQHGHTTLPPNGVRQSGILICEARALDKARKNHLVDTRENMRVDAEPIIPVERGAMLKSVLASTSNV